MIKPNIIIGLIITGVLAVLVVYIFVTYGDKPITEIPSWVLFLLGK